MLSGFCTSIRSLSCPAASLAFLFPQFLLALFLSLLPLSQNPLLLSSIASLFPFQTSLQTVILPISLKHRMQKPARRVLDMSGHLPTLLISTSAGLGKVSGHRREQPGENLAP